MTTTNAPMCMRCKHFYDDVIDDERCEAFPDGIPDKILYEGFDHTKPFKGDKGIMFKKK